MSSVGPINFAKYSGYESLAAAIVFAAIYFPLHLFFVKRSISNLTYVNVVMALFCSIRVAAFVIRAVMIKVESAAENLDVLVADQILFGIGYAGLLYSGYTLVMDLMDHAKRSSNIFRNRHPFRIAMIAAVTLGIVASSKVRKDGTYASLSVTLREVSTVIFLGLTGLLCIHALHLLRLNPSEKRVNYEGSTPIGAKHGAGILVVISLLLLIREVFVTATMTPSKRPTQFKERLWYPLIALPEILAVLLFLIPGLVPSRKELHGDHTRSKDDNGL